MHQQPFRVSAMRPCLLPSSLRAAAAFMSLLVCLGAGSGVGWAQQPGADDAAETFSEGMDTPRQEFIPAEEDIAATLDGQVELERTAALTETRPRQHVVEQGDTLWYISNTYLIDPFYWPRIWEINRHIPNPDLIYPGTVIFLPAPGVLETFEAAVPPVEEMQQELPVGAEQPPLEPLAPRRPTFTELLPEERVQEPYMMASVGYILAKDLEKTGSLIGVKDNKIMIGEGDTVYIKPDSSHSFEKGDVLLTYRKVRKVYHPKTGRYLGNLIVVLGRLDVRGVEGGIATARVTKSYHAIYGEDPVALIDVLDLPLLDPSSGEGLDLQGYVVDIRQDKALIAQYDVVYIDRGVQDGIGRGSAFKVVREGKRTSLFSAGRGVRLPSRTIGELEVIMVTEKTATAKIRKSSEAIQRGDRIEILSNQ